MQEARAELASLQKLVVTKAKDASKTAEDGLPLHSFRTLLKDLGTLAYNVTHTRIDPEI